MGSFVRCKTFYCSKAGRKGNYIEQDLFLMPTSTPSKKRKKITAATLADMDPVQRAKYEEHQKKQQDLNDNRAKRYCKLLAETNFVEGDYYFHPTYNDESLPEDFAGAEKLLANYIRRLKRIAKRKGNELKYIAVTELGSVNGRLHHHMIINASSGLTREEVENAWTYGFCNTKINHDTAAAVGYLLKADRSYKGKRIYKASRNLVKPSVSTADSKVSKGKLKDLTTASNVDIKAYFEKLNPGFYVEGLYRYVPEPEQEEQDIDEEQAKLWRDGFSYLRVCLRRKADSKSQKKGARKCC